LHCEARGRLLPSSNFESVDSEPNLKPWF
jgi:hypothetical protein